MQERHKMRNVDNWARPVSIAMKEDLLSRVDEARAEISRSRFLTNIISHALDHEIEEIVYE